MSRGLLLLLLLTEQTTAGRWLTEKTPGRLRGLRGLAERASGGLLRLAEAPKETASRLVGVLLRWLAERVRRRGRLTEETSGLGLVVVGAERAERRLLGLSRLAEGVGRGLLLLLTEAAERARRWLLCCRT